MMKRRLSVLTLLCVLLFAAVFTLSVLLTVRASDTLLDGDASSEMLLARRLYDEGTLFSENWAYSTEVKAFCPQLILAPLFALSSSWWLVRILGTTLWQLLLVGAWLFLARTLRLNLRRTGLGGAMLFLPYSIGYGRIVLLHLYYMPYAFSALTVMALFIRGLRKAASGRFPLADSLAAAVLCGVTCLSGLRFLLVFAAPLMLAWLIMLVMYLYEKKAAVSELKRYAPTLLPPFMTGAGGFIGYMIFAAVLAKHYFVISDYSARLLAPISAERLWEAVIALLGCFGYAPGVALFSLDGIAAMLSAVACVVTLALCISMAMNRNVPRERRFFSVFFLCALIVTGAVFMLMAADVDSYPLYWLLPCLWIPVLLVLPCAPEGSREKNALPPLRSVLSVCCAAAVALSGAVNMLRLLSDPIDLKGKPYEGLPYQETDLVPKLRGAVAFLDENGYDLGLTIGENDYRFTSVVTELTDGRITMAQLADGAIRRYLSGLHVLDDPAQLTANRFFVLMDQADESEETRALTETAQAVYRDDFFIVYVYDDPVSVFGELCIPAERG